MQTNLSSEFRDTAQGREAEAILRACVHCGFCTATCPTYQLLGDELDGPRGFPDVSPDVGLQYGSAGWGDAATAAHAHHGRCLEIQLRPAATVVQWETGAREILRDAAAGLIEAIGTRDAQLLVVLRAARIVPDEVWTTLAAAEATR